MIAPCKDCDKRTITCHCVCSEYTAWKKKRDDMIMVEMEKKKWKPEFNRKTINYIWKKMKKR